MIPVLLVFLLALPACDRLREAGAPAVATAPDVAYYTCPMHPSVKQAVPGKCPICGMDLTPVTKAELESGAVVVDAGRRRRLGIAVEAAAVRPMHTTLSLPAVVAWDTTRLTDVTLKVQGWVESVRVAAPGTRVRAGDVLFTLYSPDLVATQDDLLAATTQARTGIPGAQARVDAARSRLRRYGVPDARVDAVLAAGAADERLPVTAPASGTVVETTIVEGAMVSPGQTLYRIGDTSRMWVEAAVPEADVAHVRPGAAVTVRVPGRAEPLVGEVALLAPTIDATTRTARARVEVANADGALRPEQWATVEVTLDAGERLAVPEGAVIYTGPRRLVFVDTGEDRLVPREVRVGAKADGFVEIVEGLTAGEFVVTSGNFLVAADSRLRQGGETTGHEGHGSAP